MSQPSSTRLERALELFLEHQQQGSDWQQLLLRHADLADVLESFVEQLATEPGGLESDQVGDFKLLRTIGRGGTGIVYEARQRSLDRRVALKVLHERFAASPSALTRFRREAQALARLDHAGIVRVFAVGEDGGKAWLAMEFVEGESLAASLDRLRGCGGHRGDTLRRLVESIAGVARALQHAHAAGIVHRDVKPSNVLVRPDGAVVLGDFGLARDTHAPSLTQTSVVAGTPHYMAPEQARGQLLDCDARTDVFALGATLYECLTLRHAFEGSTTQEVLQAVLTRDPIDPRRHQRGLPIGLAAICQKALEKDPKARYQTALEFADDLQAFLDLRPVAAHPLTRTRRFVRRMRQQPLLGVLLVLGFSTAVLGAGLLLQLPKLRAAAAVQVESDCEDALVRGLLARTGKDRDVCYAHFGRAMELSPGRTEAIAGLCLAILHYEGPAAALAELDRRCASSDDQELGRCRAMLLRRLQRLDEAAVLEERLGPPVTSMALWLTATPLLYNAGDLVAMREASNLLSLAMRIAPRPRLLLHTQWAVLQGLLGDANGCHEAANALVQLWPDHPFALYIAGFTLLNVDSARALTLLQRALAQGLDDPLGQVNLGVAQARCGQNEAAVQTFEAALAQPGLGEATCWQLVQNTRLLGDPDAELRMVTAWLQREPHSVQARRSMARLLSRDGEHEPAIEMFRACLVDVPNDPELSEDLALALSNAGQSAEERVVLDALVTAQPTNERLHAMMLDVCDALGDSAAVLAEHQRWVEACGLDREAWRELAEVLLSSGSDNNERALAAAERADYLADGKDPAFLTLRARALERLGHNDEAARLRVRISSLVK
ncbi:MAG: protein kinase [Planctomycetota bacterium]